MRLNSIVFSGILLAGLIGILGCWDSSKEDKRKREQPNPRYIPSTSQTREQKVYKTK